jgi:hypothetical protein
MRKAFPMCETLPVISHTVNPSVGGFTLTPRDREGVWSQLAVHRCTTPSTDGGPSVDGQGRWGAVRKPRQGRDAGSRDRDPGRVGASLGRGRGELARLVRRSSSPTREVATSGGGHPRPHRRRHARGMGRRPTPAEPTSLRPVGPRGGAQPSGRGDQRACGGADQTSVRSSTGARRMGRGTGSKAVATYRPSSWSKAWIVTVPGRPSQSTAAWQRVTPSR